MSLNLNNQTINILICEDNLGDVYIITDSLENSGLNYEINHVTNGEEAIKYLTQLKKSPSSRRPDIILLDLNLPKKHGFEVLEEIKTDPEWKTIPVIILTSSKSEQDVLRTYELYGSCFVTKPFDFDEFTNVIKTIESFWFNLAKLPPPLASNS